MAVGINWRNLFTSVDPETCTPEWNINYYKNLLKERKHWRKNWRSKMKEELHWWKEQKRYMDKWAEAHSE